MGYYTFFELDIDCVSKEEKTRIIQELRATNFEAKCAINEYGYTGTETKWYNCSRDLKEFSKNYPYLLFILHGKGEENDDIWKLYVRNGKYQFCKAYIVYPEFNENLLQE